MARQKIMRKFARWHIWLGWLVGVPILMWTVTGLVMVARPIETVRGDHLRADSEAEVLPGDLDLIARIGPDADVVSVLQKMDHGEPIAIFTMRDGTQRRYSLATGTTEDIVMRDRALAVVARDIRGGERVVSADFYAADDPPFDFRRPVPSWQVALEDGTHVYVNAQTGEIAAVRTRWWRVFDFMWGLHIMDLSEREDTSHPVLILFAALGVIGSLLGCLLMFRRRKARVKTA